MLRLDNHELGPRLYVLGRRLHECHAGIGLIATAAVILIAGLPLPAPAAFVLLSIGLWLLWKDWRDLFPRLRDTTAWSPGAHRPPTPLRSRSPADGLAPVAGACTIAIGLVNIGSALTPGLHSRMMLLLRIVPREVPVAAHALALSAGIALVVLGLYLVRRRRRAWALAVTILLAAGVLNLLKGLDVEEALASWGLAALLIWGRDAFRVRPADTGWRAPLLQSAAVLGGAIATGALTLVAAAHWGSPSLTPARGLAEVEATLTLSALPIHYRDPFDWVPAGLAALSLSAVGSVAWLLFRPLAAPRGLPAAALRPIARRIVERHGSDSLSFFKLRVDKHHFFNASRTAFVGYRIEAGVLLVSGDPVGPPEALPGLLAELCEFAEARGLAVGVVGASDQFAALAAGAGLSSFYIGDEAIIETGKFSLEGRRIRKVRQAVTRARKAGFTASIERLAELPEAGLRELERVSAQWRGDEPERGFSMAIDGLRGEHLAGSIVVVARDAEGTTRGFLHFAPCYGRPAMSLGLMRRDREAVNGLTEFLVVSAIELLGESGIEEISLNFAAFARLIRDPSGIRERALARLVTLANPYFQIESLYRFNAKFSPRWQARYLLYEGRQLGFARTGLAAMWAEGQLPRPAPLRRSSPQAALARSPGEALSH